MSEQGVAEVESLARQYHGLEMAMVPAEAHRRLVQLKAFVASVMIAGDDYGVIPGTSKPTLLQPGAQKLAELYGFSHKFLSTEAVKDWTSGFFYFEYRCQLHCRRDGSFVGEGIGSCNSRESKYAGRWVSLSELPGGDKAGLQKRIAARWVFASDLPEGVDKRQRPSQQRKSKAGKTYSVYQIVDEQYLISNPDPYSIVNTLQKMACKRAYIHAVIAATRSASIFTQDLEDIPQEAFGTIDHDPETGEVADVAPVSPDPPGAQAAGRPAPPKSAPLRGRGDRGPQRAEAGQVEPAESASAEAPPADAGPAAALEPPENLDGVENLTSAAHVHDNQLYESDTLPALAEAWREVNAAFRSGLLTIEDRNALALAKETRKKQIVARAAAAELPEEGAK